MRVAAQGAPGKERGRFGGIVAAILFLLVLFSGLYAPSAASGAAGPDVSRIVESQLKALDTSDVEGFLREIDESMKDYFPGLNLWGMLRSPTEPGGRVPGPLNLVSGIARLAIKEVVVNLWLLGELLVIGVTCALLETFAGGFGSQAVTRLARSVAFLVLAVVALNSFNVAAGVVRDGVVKMASFMQALLPVVFATLAAAGSVTSVAVLSPIMISATAGVGTVIERFVLSMALMAFILEMLAHVSERFQVKKLAALFRDVAMASLGILLCVFLGVTTVKGIGTSIADGVAVRSAKYLSNTFIPFVGKMFSEAVYTVAGCSLLIQNAATLAGLAAVVFICLHPIIKILAMIIVYRFAAALIEPLGDERLAACINGLASGLIVLLVTLLAAAMLFFISVAIVGTAARTASGLM